MDQSRINICRVGIVSVNYDDILRLTLPYTIRACGTNVTVITDPSDTQTIACANAHGVSVLTTSAWYNNGAAFDKASGLNAWALSSESPPAGWLLALDADILLPPDVLQDLGSLNWDFLYGIDRRICESQSRWHLLKTGAQRLADLPIDEPRIFNGRLWGKYPTANPAAIAGYFQLWHSSATRDRTVFCPHPTADHYDIVFALSFSDRRRQLHNRVAVHLGPTGMNWSGRRMGRWPDERGDCYDPNWYEKLWE